jgi:hypothetical protein
MKGAKKSENIMPNPYVLFVSQNISQAAPNFIIFQKISGIVRKVAL